MNTSLLKSFYSQYRSVIFMSATGIASLILIGVLIIPQILSLIDSNKAYQEITSKSQFLEVKAEDLQRINSEELKNKLNTSLSVLPAEKDLNDTINVMQSITQNSGFELRSLNFSDVSAERKAFGVKLEVAGSKDMLGRLLANLETSYRPIKIRTMDIIVPKAGNNINGTIDVDVFILPIPSSIASVDAPILQLSQSDEDLIASFVEQTSQAGITTSPATQTTNLPSRGKSNPFE